MPPRKIPYFWQVKRRSPSGQVLDAAWHAYTIWRYASPVLALWAILHAVRLAREHFDLQLPVTERPRVAGDYTGERAAERGHAQAENKLPGVVKLTEETDPLCSYTRARAVADILPLATDDDNNTNVPHRGKYEGRSAPAVVDIDDET